jgi:hypothetical protein
LELGRLGVVVDQVLATQWADGDGAERGSDDTDLRSSTARVSVVDNVIDKGGEQRRRALWGSGEVHREVTDLEDVREVGTSAILADGADVVDNGDLRSRFLDHNAARRRRIG